VKTRDYQVVIVGGGFAGMATAQNLARTGAHVALIDQNNYHQFHPLLYQVATAQIAVPTVARPLRAIFRHTSIDVKTATVESIDPRARSVTTIDGIAYRGQILVIATGAQPNFFNIPGAADNSFPLYSVDDASRLRSRLLGALDAGDRSQDYIDRGVLNIVIVGAGPTGVELAGALAESLRLVVPRYLPKAIAEHAKIYLIDLLPTVLPFFSAASQKYTTKALCDRDIELILGVGVTEVRKDGVVLADGRTIPSRSVVWAGGSHGGRALGASGLPRGKGGRVDVDPDLTAPGFPGVYVLGDAANITDAAGNQLPQLAAVAQQAGSWAARNILADLDGRPRAPFVYHDRGILAMIRRGVAVAEIGHQRRPVTGVAAFLLWLVVHLMLLSGVRERINAFISWIWVYLTRTRPQILVDRPDAYAIDWNKHPSVPRQPNDADRSVLTHLFSRRGL
jgi:NADH:ubiquinone reductase (H+-translocating)